jgi:hypothetical protein
MKRLMSPSPAIREQDSGGGRGTYYHTPLLHKQLDFRPIDF